jgi:hypothetical protein
VSQASQQGPVASGSGTRPRDGRLFDFQRRIVLIQVPVRALRPIECQLHQAALSHKTTSSEETS